MNTYKKLPTGGWAIVCDALEAPGSVVTVSLKRGTTKQVKLGGLLYSLKNSHVFAIDEPPKPAKTGNGQLLTREEQIAADLQRVDDIKKVREFLSYNGNPVAREAFERLFNG